MERFVGKVRRINTDAGAFSIVATTASTNVGIAAPVSSQTLQYAVQACNAHGCSGFTNAPQYHLYRSRGGAADRGSARTRPGGCAMNTSQGIALAALLLTTAQARAEDTVHYYYTDPQGTALAKADAAGNVIASYDYAPYGSQAMGAPPSGGPTGYTGHVNDPDTGLVYMQARYYDPEVGRFLSVDPVGVGVGDAFNFNRFAYANNNPIVNDDPTGRAICSASGGGGCEKIKEQNRARDRAEQGSIEAQAPGSSAFMTLGGGFHASPASGTVSRSIPRNTPASMRQYFGKSDPRSMAKAAVATMDYFGIDHSGVTCCAIVMGNTENAEMSPDGLLGISEPLFSHSFGMIGAILFHEVGVHWDMQFSKGAILDGMYTQAWYMREIQACDMETNASNSRRFGLTPAEVEGERVKRNGYMSHLTPWNRDSVERGYYKP